MYVIKKVYIPYTSHIFYITYNRKYKKKINLIYKNNKMIPIVPALTPILDNNIYANN